MEKDLDSLWDTAEDFIADGRRTEARGVLEDIVSTDVTADDAIGLRAKERAIYRLAEILSVEKQTDMLVQLLSAIRSFFALLPKAKATRMVRKMFDLILNSGASLDRQMEVCRDMIAWARQEKRTFLRQRLQHRLAEVQFARNERQEALTTLQALLREVRRLDDRALLLDIHLLESHIYYSIRNISRARAALVAARTNANSIYCPPLAQAEIDLQSGVLHAEEHDAKTAFSYLYEAFEGFHQLGDQARQARKALHYMILAKIATNSPDELSALLSSKNVLEYKGADMVALHGVADAYNSQDTHLFNRIMQENKNAPFLEDEVLQRQLSEMYKSLLEGHLLKLLEPYSRVQISYLAELLKLDVETVESQVSQLILDKKLAGIVDQQHQCVVVFDEQDAKREKAKQKGDGTSDGSHGVSHSSAYHSGGTGTSGSGDVTSATTLYQDALDALEKYDKLVTALFDKANGKFDALVEENLAKRTAAKQVDAKGKKAKDEAGSGAEKGDGKKPKSEPKKE
ncbi:proteasome regulatory non-ATPase subunit 6 [Trypanosoma equiperdum]|nr:proteasome regulatory non-ATPase subunit 6 [Trypanosoma brucei gambiense DAL972]XP_951546.1 proteasome regulatory non-ATPase subunit 6 [Trypanosoma brucei brucei TREU927]AAX79155.1 proteasome regulatory non-ATPase subunit 6 [Trypanosoma brucei]SCU68378.1 proteasome regulatory non-ATPase subunit 6 [Trypanosoma equiperdum]AAQ15701.1 proteasome regulatory non-ATPase subunit 6 [Trypanosoma brucei brucei TREU927]CBH09374.1 proteasome regulatory non-ATPase subunit 6 [Trypanosoma brucei gambiense |eukprot:XP_011771680.1 proteasome regulatory non-ATPase subunit 6 [Trypanosoma brucei gambiense DAL972]